MTIRYEETRRSVVEAGLKTSILILVVGTWELSTRVKGEELMAITRVVWIINTYPEDIVVMDFGGNVVIA